MNTLVHIITLALTVRATAELKAGTFVRYSGGYSGTTPILGVVIMDTKVGELASVGVRGLYQVKVAAGSTFAVGDPLAVNAAGLGIVGAGSMSVFEFTPTLATVIL